MQEAGGKRQEAGGKKQEAGSKKQEARSKRQDIGCRMQDTQELLRPVAVRVTGFLFDICSQVEYNGASPSGLEATGSI